MLDNEAYAEVFRRPLRVLMIKWILRLFLIKSTLYGFWFVFNMDQYLPWQARLLRGIKLTSLGHCGLWMAAIEIKSTFRYEIATILIPSMIGVFILWWTLHLTTAIAALGAILWLIHLTVRGETLGHQSFDNT